MIDWLRRHDTWKCIFEKDEDERRRAKNRSQAFAAICQAMKNDQTIYYSKVFSLMRELDDPDPKDAYDYILKIWILRLQSKRK